MPKTRRALLLMSAILSLLFLNLCTEEPFEPNIKGSIKGEVRDAETQKLLANVTITTEPSSEVILTDSTGHYEIPGLDTGRYSVIAEKNDYQRRMLGILVKKSKTHEVNFLLNPADKKKEGEIKFSNNFHPQNGATDQPANITLSWKAYEENGDDSITYEVKMFNGNSMEEYLKAENLKDTSLTVKPLPFNHIYYWQVIAKNARGDTAHSKMLSFQTRDLTGNSIFFVREIEGNYEIMARDFEYSEISRVTYNNYRDWAPKRNKKNGRIAFVNDSKVKSYVYTMDKNCEQITKVTDIAVDGYHNDGDAFAWDEDAGTIIFSHYEDLYEINADGTGMQKITTAPANWHFSEVVLSPDNSKIVVLTRGKKVYNTELHLMDRDGSNREVLIDTLAGIMKSPAFSIDGKSIVFTWDVSDNQDQAGRMLDSRIFRLSLEDTEITDLSTNKPRGTNDLNPTYSPSGHKIIFTNIINDNSKPPAIWMMDPDGTNREKMIENAKLPSWK